MENLYESSANADDGADHSSSSIINNAFVETSYAALFDELLTKTAGFLDALYTTKSIASRAGKIYVKPLGNLAYKSIEEFMDAIDNYIKWHENEHEKDVDLIKSYENQYRQDRAKLKFLLRGIGECADGTDKQHAAMLRIIQTQKETIEWFEKNSTFDANDYKERLRAMNDEDKTLTVTEAQTKAKCETMKENGHAANEKPEGETKPANSKRASKKMESYDIQVQKWVESLEELRRSKIKNAQVNQQVDHGASSFLASASTSGEIQSKPQKQQTSYSVEQQPRLTSFSVSEASAVSYPSRSRPTVNYDASALNPASLSKNVKPVVTAPYSEHCDRIPRRHHHEQPTYQPPASYQQQTSRRPYQYQAFNGVTQNATANPNNASANPSNQRAANISSGNFSRSFGPPLNPMPSNQYVLPVQRIPFPGHCSHQ